MKFHTYPVADISTAHLTARDRQLILDEKLGLNLGVIARGQGSLFLVPNDLQDLEAEWADLRALGFSKAFVSLMSALSAQEIPYVRFDADGHEVEGAPTFDDED